MIELEIAQQLKEIYDRVVIGEKATLAAVYFEQISKFSNKDFPKIQQECTKLGFYVYKANNCPVDTEFLKREYRKKRFLVVYSDFSLTQINDTITDFRRG